MSGKALFWDFDGTLIHPNESFFTALSTSLQKYAYEIEPQKIRTLLHATCSWYKPEISYEGMTGAKWWEELFRAFIAFYKENGVLPEHWKKLNEMFQAYILDYKNYILFDDARVVLKKSRQMGYENYIISNNYPELADVIGDFGLSEYFSDFIVSANCGFEKPGEEIFRHARSVAHDPDILYMIGDNPVADIAGGKKAGYKTILVHREEQERTPETDFLCRELKDILPVLEEHDCL